MIYKYVLEIDVVQILEAPAGATWLSAQMQQGELCLWGMVEPDNPMHVYGVTLVGTGPGHVQPAPEAQYIDTVQTHGGRLVWHVYVRILSEDVA